MTKRSLEPCKIPKLNIPKSDQYETLGGFIVNFTEEIPVEGERLEIEQFLIKILKTSNTKIETVELKLIVMIYCML